MAVTLYLQASSTSSDTGGAIIALLSCRMCVSDAYLDWDDLMACASQNADVVGRGAGRASGRLVKWKHTFNYTCGANCAVRSRVRKVVGVPCLGLILVYSLRFPCCSAGETRIAHRSRARAGNFSIETACPPAGYRRLSSGRIGRSTELDECGADGSCPSDQPRSPQQVRALGVL